MKMRNKQEKWEVLSNGKYLRETEIYYGTYMALDMDKEEMEKNKILRRELIQRRSEGDNVMIKMAKL